MKYLAVAYILFILLIVVLADSGLGENMFNLVKNIPAGDKIGHFFLMGTLSFFVNISLSASKIRVFSLNILKGSFIIWVLVTLEEISQIFLPFRSFCLIDLICDYCGIFCLGKIATVPMFNQKHNTVNE